MVCHLAESAHYSKACGDTCMECVRRCLGGTWEHAGEAACCRVPGCTKGIVSISWHCAQEEVTAPLLLDAVV